MNDKATISFNSHEQAVAFATLYSRKTLLGYMINNKTVTVWNVTDDIRAWINEYVENIKSLDQILKNDPLGML